MKNFDFDNVQIYKNDVLIDDSKRQVYEVTNKCRIVNFEPYLKQYPKWLVIRYKGECYRIRGNNLRSKYYLSLV